VNFTERRTPRVGETHKTDEASVLPKSVPIAYDTLDSDAEIQQFVVLERARNQHQADRRGAGFVARDT
jgi:hypothetical protein